MVGVELPACPVEVTLSVIGNKWKVLIIRDLLSGTKRFGELKASVSGISQKVLSSNLKDMEAGGILNRRSYDEIPPRVEYSLTELGRSLQPVLESMIEWGESYRAYRTKLSHDCQPPAADRPEHAEDRVHQDVDPCLGVGLIDKQIDGIDRERRHGGEGSEEPCEYEGLHGAVGVDSVFEHQERCKAASDDVHDERRPWESRLDGPVDGESRQGT